MGITDSWEFQKEGRKQGEKGLRNFLSGIMFTMWMMGLIEAQTSASHCISL